MPAIFVRPCNAARQANTRARRMRSNGFVALAAISVVVPMLLAGPAPAASPTVPLGGADRFAVLAGSGITNTGLTSITGDVGTFPTPSETGFDSVALDGTNHKGDSVTQAAKADLAASYRDAATRDGATEVGSALGGLTLGPGAYKSVSFGVAGTLTLDGRGKTDAAFIFQAGSTVITEVNSRVLLVNGADPCNVVWQVGSSATFKAGARFVGDVLVHASITAQAGATFRGRLLAQEGAVTLDSNTVSMAACATPTAAASASGASTGPLSSGGVALPPSGASNAVTAPLIGRPVTVAAPPEATGGESAPARWTLIAPHDNLPDAPPAAPPLLAVVGGSVDALARTALILLGVSVAASAALIARRRQVQRRQPIP